MSRCLLIRRWTPEDDEALVLLLERERMPVRAIAIKLRRSPNAVRKHIYDLRIVTRSCRFSDV
jgi:predicted ArsR family transcriptional regulator